MEDKIGKNACLKPSYSYSALLSSIWKKRTDRYSDECLDAQRTSSYDPKSHKKIEMIFLGG
jgi:hypothetical protein